jgi:hypothetical protein
MIAMGKRRPPPLPEPDKPLAEMTPAERDAYTRAVMRVIRDDEVRRGARRPRTMREIELAREGRAEREERLARRIARAERRSSKRADAGIDPACAGWMTASNVRETPS